MFSSKICLHVLAVVFAAVGSAAKTSQESASDYPMAWRRSPVENQGFLSSRQPSTKELEEEKPVVALILARSGSKGIHLKNLETIADESLLARTLRVTHETGLFKQVWVSTDHDRIANEAFQNGALVHIRPSNVSADTTSSIVSVQEFLDHHPEVQTLALIQCTSVFQKASYLKEAFRKIQSADCVFAVVRSWKLRWKTIGNKSSEKRLFVPLNFESDRRPRRQDWSGELVETGMFYFAQRKLLESGRFQNEKCGFVEVESRDALEIDTMFDLDLAKFIVESI